MAHPLQNTDNENLARILQQLLKETRELKADNKSLREELQKSSSRQTLDRDRDNESTDSQTRQRRRKVAPKECQVINFSSGFS